MSSTQGRGEEGWGSHHLLCVPASISGPLAPQGCSVRETLSSVQERLVHTEDGTLL